MQEKLLRSIDEMQEKQRTTDKKMHNMRTQQEELQNLIAGSDNQRAGGYLSSSDGFLSKPEIPNNTLVNTNSSPTMGSRRTNIIFMISQ